MDVVLGVSMAPETVRLVLVEGQSAGGVTVDEDTFELAPDFAADEVIAAILGTQESAAESGHQLQSSGVTWTDPLEADALRDALAAHKIENVMLVSAFVAAAALAQAVGSATNCARTALLFVEPTTATLAVVDSSDGSIADVHRQPLSQGGEAAVAELAAMVSGVEAMEGHPESLFLVGSGIDIADIPLIKPALEASTPLSVTTPEEPETALARGAALASANAALGAPATVAIPQAAAVVGPGVGGLAYSAVDLAEGADPEERSRKALLLAMTAMSIFVVGVVALALALALGIRPHVEQRSSLSKNVVAPARHAPAPKVPAPAPPPPTAPAPPVQQPAPTLAPPEREPPPRPREWDRWDHRRWERGGWP